MLRESDVEATAISAGFTGEHGVVATVAHHTDDYGAIDEGKQRAASLGKSVERCLHHQRHPYNVKVSEHEFTSRYSF